MKGYFYKSGSGMGIDKHYIRLAAAIYLCVIYIDIPNDDYWQFRYGIKSDNWSGNTRAKLWNSTAVKPVTAKWVMCQAKIVSCLRYKIYWNVNH